MTIVTEYNPVGSLIPNSFARYINSTDFDRDFDVRENGDWPSCILTEALIRSKNSSDTIDSKDKSNDNYQLE
tara:strand:- start:718 stop:933 length:216 start_codon:yes stop_codon:yes gene_type:complete